MTPVLVSIAPPARGPRPEHWPPAAIPAPLAEGGQRPILLLRTRE